MKKILPFLTFLFIFGLFFLPVGADAAEDHHHLNFLKQYEQLDDAKKQQVDQILNQLHQELEKLGVKTDHPNPHQILSQLDDQKKQQILAIIKELDEEKISSEEANKKLEQLGVIPKNGHCQAFENLDEETKQKAKEIWKELKSGSITREEAEKRFQELGIEMPKKQELDEETKAKVKEAIEKAEQQFENLGLEFPKHFYKHLAR
ncbi:hypothetical protein NST62_05995 [Ureibacillus sp. FSL K6-8385]|uniref:DUF2680 domain-containing protein n=1 Tax=Ureibacillus terrenus TaxID=118246 RepID=A0A540V5Y9_9BACL|nr:hypothetical protein [Ureibacillus terrenus]MED3660841.1 hypothetical protein [Ureibacillus terrenus]MED3763029.1 hypothetical protein [Ureibacillus terrenus]TQE92174.1 hypothetical protein FKZ59_00260 [Ureibacillus terrenus]